MTAASQKQWQFLRKSAELGKVAHAYLFYGGNAKEKKEIAVEVINLVNCEVAVKPCGVCRSCLAIDKNSSPDFFLIEPEEGEIKIARIRDLHSSLSLRSYSSPYKSVLIDGAHTLNWEAQSAFLKLLEEPKGKTLFILSTDYPERLLPTIISRAEKLRLYSPPVKISGNEEMEKIVSDLASVSKKSLSGRFVYAKKLAEDSENLNMILSVWLTYFREQMLESASGKETDYPLDRLRAILNSIQNTSLLVSTTNVSSRLALEVLMLEL